MSWLKLFVTFRTKVWLIQMIFFNMIGKICLILSDVFTHTALPFHPLYTMHPQGHALDQSLEIWGVQKKVRSIRKGCHVFGLNQLIYPCDRLTHVLSNNFCFSEVFHNGGMLWKCSEDEQTLYDLPYDPWFYSAYHTFHSSKQSLCDLWIGSSKSLSSHPDKHRTLKTRILKLKLNLNIGCHLFWHL